uniref:Uncharacterized protein n=1 Tax=Cajanus cajan TaxID=3821 RepID=A0A151T3L8_CAJCA|nr:hypothetical protein KK1_016148 [Cajanus cajan]
MEERKNSKVMMHTAFSYEQGQYHSNNLECNNVLKNNAIGNPNSFQVAPDPKEYSFEVSDSDSDSDSCSDEEVSLDEFLNDGGTKKKIEQLAAMVGVDTTEPVIVLTEVVRLLKHFNYYYTSTTS